MKKIGKRIVDAIRNRKKPTLGAISWVLTYGVCRLVVGMDDLLAAGTATTVSTYVVSHVGPIFGIDVDGPTYDPVDKEIEISVPPANSLKAGPIRVRTRRKRRK